MTMTGGSILTAEELLLYRSARPERSLPRKGVKEFVPNNSWLHKKQIENILDERKSLLDVERVEKVGALSIAIWDEGLNLAFVTYMTGRPWDVFGHKYATKLALHPEEALFLLETNSLQLLHNDVALSIQQGYSTLLGTKTGCPLNYYKVYSHLVRHGFRLLRHAPPSMTDYERQIGLHHYLENKSEKASSSLNKNSQASSTEDMDVSNSSSESIINHMDVKDTDFQEIKSDEVEVKMKFHSINHSSVGDKCVDNVFSIETHHSSNLPVRVESQCADKGSENISALGNLTNNKSNMEVTKNDEYSSLNVNIPQTSVMTINTEKEISEQEFCLYEKIEMTDDYLSQNKSCSEYVNGVKCTSPDKPFNHQEIIPEKNIPKVGENVVNTASCGDSNDTFPEVFVISDSSDDSEAIDVETIPEEHNLSQKLKNNTRNNTELGVKLCKLDAECEIVDIGCGSVKLTGKKDLNTSENADIIFVNEIIKPHTNRPQKRRSEFLKDCIIDVETDTLIRCDQVMPRKKVKSNSSMCPVNTFTKNNKSSLINCEIVDVCQDDVKPDSDSSNVHFKAEEIGFYEEIDVESDHPNKSNLEDWQSILNTFPNFANSEKAVVKLPDPKFLPPNVTPYKTEYILYFRHGNERMMRPYRRQNYRQRGFGNCNSTYGMVGSRNMERQSFPRRNLNPGLLGPCPQQFKIFMGTTRYEDYYLVPNNLSSNVYNNLVFQQPFINTCAPYETGILPCSQNQFQQPHFNQNQQEFVSQCDQIMERQFPDSCSYASTAQNNSSNGLITSSRKGRRKHYRPVDEYGGKNPMMNKKNRPRFNSNRYFATSKKFQPQMEHNYVMEVVNREWKEFLKYSDGAKSWSEIKRKIDEKPHEMKVEGNDEIKEELVEPDIGDEAEKEEVDIKPLLEPSDCLNIGNVLSKLQIFQEPKFQNGFAPLNSELTAQFDLYLPNKRFKKSSPSTPDFRVCVVGCESDIPSQRDIALLCRRFQDNVPLLFAVVIPGSVTFYHFSNVRLPEDRSVPI